MQFVAPLKYVHETQYNSDMILSPGHVNPLDIGYYSSFLYMYLIWTSIFFYIFIFG